MIVGKLLDDLDPLVSWEITRRSDENFEFRDCLIRFKTLFARNLALKFVYT